MKSVGVYGHSKEWIGIQGESDQLTGVFGKSKVWLGVHGESERSTGVYGKSYAGTGLHGESAKGSGVIGFSEAWIGVYGESKDQPPLSVLNQDIPHGEAEGKVHHQGPKIEKGIGIGVLGKSTSGRGVLGESQTNTAVEGQSNAGFGVWGESKTNTGVVGKSKSGIGIWAESETFEALHAETRSPRLHAITALHLNPVGTGAALFAKKEGQGGHAGFFEGNVHVTGNITADGDICCQGADFAEDFNVVNEVDAEPGTVMILGEEDFLRVSANEYDKRVAGIISGAGTYRPGIILDKQQSVNARKPLALMGKVFCKVDAQYGAIETGDLLTTSFTPGHAMKASDPVRAFGAVIGKALKPLANGQGYIPVLVSLR